MTLTSFLAALHEHHDILAEQIEFWKGAISFACTARLRSNFDCPKRSRMTRKGRLWVKRPLSGLGEDLLV